MSSPEVFILIIVLLVTLPLSLRFILSGRQSSNLKYEKNKSLFSHAERSFLGVLESSLPEGLRVFGKVRVADVLSPSKENGRKGWQAAFNKISSKHFDYILCDASTLQVQAAIELDDKSHKSKITAVRDRFLNEACQTAQLPIIRFNAKRAYTIKQVQEHILNSLSEHDTVTNDTNKDVASTTREGLAPADKTLLSSSKVAKSLGKTTDDFMSELLLCGYIENKDGEMSLTEKGKSIGGEHVQKSRFGPYFKWPSDFDPSWLEKNE
ncbi:MAG: hypothetical protein CBB95_09725 [Alteromonas sp. TMED35]|jgi:predicted transcriptional regulator|uniref:DUF2726 domain-containing protein n=1 Tax=uncultured Alteromonas sp. TaxID=179113 RepID=UPI000B68E359|nr:MAG: hypothetical protein CBB95_09725 [Alteromonas sp. TMED35]|tara:strand:+ start:3571 stop:4368 length:798 start_codon:yes stop_codon:yes gene_type:complete